MVLMKRQLSVKTIQWIIWIILFTIHTLALLPYDPLGQSMLYSALYTSAYMIIIYGNAFFLLPVLYEKGHKVWYIVLVVVMIPLVAFWRFYSSFLYLQPFLCRKAGSFSLVGYYLIAYYLYIGFYHQRAVLYRA
jgi:hypothetical protein